MNRYLIWIPRPLCISKDDQLVLEGCSSDRVVNGPSWALAGTGTRVTRRKAIVLKNTEYATITDTETCDERIERGPQKLFLGLDDKLQTQASAVELSNTEYLRVTDVLTGKVKHIIGPCLYWPEVQQRHSNKSSGSNLSKTQYLHIKNEVTGEKRLVKGPQLFFPDVNEKVLSSSEAINLNSTGYIHVHNLGNGDMRLVKGPCLFFVEPDEKVTHQGSALALKTGEYVKVMDKQTGAVQVRRGETLIFLQPHESLMQDKSKGIHVDSEHAVMVKEVSTGALTLVTEPQLFIPTSTQEIVRVHEVIRLEEFETVIIKDARADSLAVKKGPTSFFLGPHQELVTQWWSSGITKDRRQLQIGAPPNLFDSRPHFMWYEFDCRTRDNVELVLGVTFFWSVLDVVAMIATTDDASGDLCSHARSSIISAVSQLPLENFLATFNTVVKLAVMDPQSVDPFYSTRGIGVYEVEVRSVSCKDPATQSILQEIITGHTHRINELQKQEGDNEVKLKRCEGDIEAERVHGRLLELRKGHAAQEGELQGLAEAARVTAFFENTAGVLPEQQDREALFNTLRKAEMLKDLSQGNASMVFTPADVDLKIDAKAGTATPQLRSKQT